MKEILFTAIVGIFAAIGFIETCKMMIEAATAGMQHSLSEASLVIPVQGEVEDIEYVVKKAVHEITPLSSERADVQVIIVDLGMEEQTRKICEYLARELGCIHIADSEEAIELIKLRHRQHLGLQ